MRDSPLRIQMIGAPGVGKTSFLGAIGLLSQNADGTATVAGRTLVTLLDSGSKRSLDDLRKRFAIGQWPDKTVAGQAFAIRLHAPGQSVSVTLEDIAGEVFEGAIRRGDDDSASQHLAGLIARADLLMLMVDGGQLDGDAPLPEGDLIQAIAEKSVPPHSPTPLRVAVVVTKADLCRRHVVSTPQQAARRVRRRMPALVELLRQHADEVHWFPLSVCGYAPSAVATPAVAGAGTVPPRFVPTGFDRLFDYWMSLARPPRRAPWRPLLVALFLLVAGGLAFAKYWDDGVLRQRQTLQNTDLRIEDLPSTIAEENRPHYRERLLQTLRQAAVDIDQASTIREVDAILRRNGQFPPLAEQLVGEELAALEQTALQQKERLLAQRLIVAAGDGNDVAIGQAVEQYLALFPSGPSADQARALLAAAADKKQLQQRSDIRTLVVRDAASLERKLELIAAYTALQAAALSADDRQDIQTAVTAAQRMLRPAQYDVTLVRTAGLDRPRAHGVTVLIGGQRVAQFDDSGAVAEKIWNRHFSVRWQIGSRVELTLDNYRFSNHTIAYFDVAGPLGILALAKRNEPSRMGEKYLSDPPAVSVSLKCAQLPDATVRALQEWIYPGENW